MIALLAILAWRAVAAEEFAVYYIAAFFGVAAEDEVPFDELRPAIDEALAEAAAAGVVGGAVTPFVLHRIATATGGRTVAANVALVERNAAVAAAIASALAQGMPKGRSQMRT